MTDDEKQKAKLEAAEKVSKLTGSSPQEYMDALKVKETFDAFHAKYGESSAKAMLMSLALWLNVGLHTSEKPPIKPEEN